MYLILDSGFELNSVTLCLSLEHFTPSNIHVSASLHSHSVAEIIVADNIVPVPYNVLMVSHPEKTMMSNSEFSPHEQYCLWVSPFLIGFCWYADNKSQCRHPDPVSQDIVFVVCHVCAVLQKHHVIEATCICVKLYFLFCCCLCLTGPEATFLPKRSIQYFVRYKA